MAIGSVITFLGSGKGATLTVNAPLDSKVTIDNGDSVSSELTGIDGKAIFDGLSSGVWDITLSDLDANSNNIGKTSQINIVTDYEMTLDFFSATITINYPTGSICTCTDSTGDIVLTAPDTSGYVVFTVPKADTWKVKCLDESTGESADQTFVITEDGQSEMGTLSYVKIYGIQRDITQSSPEWVRTDDAVGFTATASVGTVAGHSDFDNCYPWSGIQRETLSTGDVMVKIPRFWFKRWRDGNVEHIQIADKEMDGFALHPAFNHADQPKDCIYVGAYKTSSNNKSISGASPTVSQTRATMRSNAKNKGTGWSLIDISTMSAIQMLILAEFATNNVQTAIGRGYCDKTSGDARINTGSTNSVPNLTGRPSGTDGLVDVVWRGIEGFWGNIWEFADGVNFNGGTYYVCNDPSKYADATASNYTALSFKGATNWSQSYITEEGLDTGANEHVMLPAAAGSGSESTFDCDACWSSTGWRIFERGGYWSNGSSCGLFAAILSDTLSYAGTGAGSRLIYIPQEVTV